MPNELLNHGEKLVRDGYVKIIPSRQLWLAGPEEYQYLLKQKFAEEYWEAKNAATREQKLEELADMTEVLLTLQGKFPGDDWRSQGRLLYLLRGLFQIEEEEVEKAREEKFARLGGFGKGLVLRLKK